MPKAEAQAALQAALTRGGKPDKEVWDIWLWSGADINTASEHNGKTALMMAAQVGDADIAEYLLSRGARVDLANAKNGQTALMYAAAVGMLGHRQVADLLIAKGADITLRDHAGKIAMDYAAPASDMHQLLSAAWIVKFRDHYIASSAYGQRRSAATQRFKLR